MKGREGGKNNHLVKVEKGRVGKVRAGCCACCCGEGRGAPGQSSETSPELKVAALSLLGVDLGFVWFWFFLFFFLFLTPSSKTQQRNPLLSEGGNVRPGGWQG